MIKYCKPFSKLGVFRFISVFGDGTSELAHHRWTTNLCNRPANHETIETRETWETFIISNQPIYQSTCASLSQAWREKKPVKIPGEEAKRCFLNWKMSPRRILLENAKNRVDLQDRPIVGTDIPYFDNIIDILILSSLIVKIHYLTSSKFVI